MPMHICSMIAIYMRNINMYRTNTGWLACNKMIASMQVPLHLVGVPFLAPPPPSGSSHSPHYATPPSHRRVSGVNDHQSFLPPPPPSHSPNRSNSAPYQYDQVTAIHVLVASSTRGHTHYQLFNVVYVVGYEKGDHIAQNAIFWHFSNCHHFKASRAPGF